MKQDVLHCSVHWNNDGHALDAFFRWLQHVPKTHNFCRESYGALLAFSIPLNGALQLPQVGHIVNESLIGRWETHLEVLTLSEVLECGDIPLRLVDEVSADGITLHNRHGINLTS